MKLKYWRPNEQTNFSHKWKRLFKTQIIIIHTIHQKKHQLPVFLNTLQSFHRFLHSHNFMQKILNVAKKFSCLFDLFVSWNIYYCKVKTMQWGNINKRENCKSRRYMWSQVLRNRKRKVLQSENPKPNYLEVSGWEKTPHTLERTEQKPINLLFRLGNKLEREEEKKNSLLLLF